MAGAVSGFRKVQVLLGCGGYLLLMHLAVSGNDAEPVRLALLSLPLLALGCWIVTRSSNRPFWLLILLAAGAAAYLLEREDRLGLAALYGLPHAAAYVFLLWFFGRTLLRGQESLITRLARQVHGTLPPYMEAYTRGLTLAWCVFFIAQLVMSALLLKFASLDTWAVFINLLNFPLLALMFAGDYFYRVTRFRDYPHASIAQEIRAFFKDLPFSGSSKAR